MSLAGADLTQADLSGLDLSGYDLTGADLTGADLSESNLSWCRLARANLYKAKIVHCELLGADLSHANLNEAVAHRAGFGAATLEGASLVHATLEEATFSEAKLTGADLRTANLEGASLRKADLQGINLTRAKLVSADLKESDVNGAHFDLADLRDSRLLGLRNFEKATWIGTDIRGMDMRGAYLIRRFIMDENYLYEFRTRGRYHRILYWLWWATSDCGRSLLRWTLCIVAVTAVFAVLYSVGDVDYGDHETWASPMYYSVVTLTTLGYGDVLPASAVCQILAAIEALLGYIGLGGFLSILSNKIARRAE